jgi:hypothetical protein
MAGYLPMPSAFVLSLASGFPSVGGLTHHQVTELVLRHLPILMAG